MANMLLLKGIIVNGFKVWNLQLTKSDRGVDAVIVIVIGNGPNDQSLFASHIALIHLGKSMHTNILYSSMVDWDL